MALASNITRRIGSKNYYARVTVPKDVQEKLRKKEIWKSLETTDPAEAKRRARSILEQFDHEFSRLRAKRTLTEHELQAAVWERYTSLVRSDQQRRIDLPTEEDLDEIWKVLVVEFGDDHHTGAWRILEEIASAHDQDRHLRCQRLALLKSETAKGETRSVSDVVTQFAAERDLHLPRSSAQERKLAHFLQRAEIEALNRAAEHDRGEFGGVARDPAIKPPSTVAPIVALPGESIMELFETFTRDNPNGSTAGTLEQSRTVMNVFCQFVGNRFPASQITKKEVREWKSALRDYPIKAAEIAAFRNLDFRQTIDANRKLGKRTISDKTLNRYLAALGSFCKWLVAHGYLNDVPTAGMFIKVDKTRQKVFPYSADELGAIFSSPLYTGCASNHEPHKPGDFRIYDHRYWVPLMSLFSGARMGELCQLTTSDLIQMHGSWVFQITTESSQEQRLKTKASQRLVPVHPQLLELGLIEHLLKMKERGELWLFPEITPCSRESRSGKMSDFYRKYVARIGVKTDKSVNFHSFRHSFTDALRRAGHLDHQFAFLLGHTQNNVTGRYGALAEGDLNRRVLLVESVSYPGLSPALSRLATWVNHFDVDEDRK